MSKARTPQIIAIVIAIVSLVSFFLPYISATPEYAKYLDTRASEKVYSSADITVGDMKEMSLFEYAKVYFQAGKEIYRDEAAGIFYTVLIGSIALFALLDLLFALGKKPIPMIIFSILMGLSAYLVYWDFTDRRIMPDGDRVWGVAYYLYYPCAIILLVSGIWMLIVKKKAKRQAKLSA